jgi:hypothetical protein
MTVGAAAGIRLTYPSSGFCMAAMSSWYEGQWEHLLRHSPLSLRACDLTPFLKHSSSPFLSPHPQRCRTVPPSAMYTLCVHLKETGEGQAGSGRGGTSRRLISCGFNCQPHSPWSLCRSGPPSAQGRGDVWSRKAEKRECWDTGRGLLSIREISRADVPMQTRRRNEARRWEEKIIKNLPSH